MTEIKHKTTGAVLHTVDADNLSGANLSWANLSEADLSGALRQSVEPTTHADSCWSWGPTHYECALREIARQREVIETWRAAHIEATGADQ